ncbi:MAG: hypothetical protein ACYDAB_13700 [bacterium]
MAEQRPAAPAPGGREAAGGAGAERAGGARAARDTGPRPSQSVIYWRYLIFWLLFFAFVYFVTLYGIVAEA